MTETEKETVAESEPDTRSSGDPIRILTRNSDHWGAGEPFAYHYYTLCLPTYRNVARKQFVTIIIFLFFFLFPLSLTLMEDLLSVFSFFCTNIYSFSFCYTFSLVLQSNLTREIKANIREPVADCLPLGGSIPVFFFLSSVLWDPSMPVAPLGALNDGPTGSFSRR